MPGPGETTAPGTGRLGARDRAVELVSAVPVWAWLTLLIGLSVVIRTLFALRDPGPWIWQDELLYSELAKSLAATGHFTIRDNPGTGGFGIVYPTLVSPAWGLFTSIPSAYTAAKVINAVLMSLAALPVYFLARRLVSKPFALGAVVLALALPSMVYTATIMTENAFYPVFLFWVLTAVRALERPTALRQLAPVALTFVAYLTRNQGAVLVPALVTAILLFVLLEAWADERRFVDAALRRVAAFWVTWVTLLVGIVGYFALEVGVRHKSTSNALLGGYTVLTESSYSVGATLRWALRHLAELDLATGILPLAAFLVLLVVGLRRRVPSRELRIFTVVSLSASVWLVLEVAAFATTAFGQQIQERNLFYLEPLFLIALVAWAAGALPRVRVVTAAAAVVAAALLAYPNWQSYVDNRIYTNAFGLLPLERLAQHGWVTPAHFTWAVVLLGIAAGVLFVLLPARLALVAPAAVLLYLAVVSSPIVGLTHKASMDARYGAILGQRNWIDSAVGTKPRVSALWTGSPDVNFVSLWDNEFFNRSVGPVYNIHGPPDGLPQETLTFDYPTAQYRHADGRPVPVDYLLTDRSQTPTGTLVASDEGTGMMLYRVQGPLQLSYETQGIYRDAWSGGSATFTIYHCRGGRLRFALLSDPDINPYRQHIVARDSGSGRVLARTVSRPNGKVVRFVVPVPSGQSTCRIGFTVSPTGVPKERIQSGDTRDLGIRFLQPAYEPG